ncbi:MAG: hypothetical protein ACOCRK_07755 [bacterium]
MNIEQIIGRTVKILIDSTWYNQDYKGELNWEMYAQSFGFREIAQRTYRLYRSQHFGDPDYPSCVLDLFNNILSERNEEITLRFATYVLKSELNMEDPEVIKKDPELFQELGLLEEDEILEATFIAKEKILDINNLPDYFYEELQEQINKAYIYGLYSAVLIFARKFLENLIIDILRKKYGMENIEMFYNPSQGRFWNFNTLINNLESKLADFRPIESSININLVDDINVYRQKGNASAHSITLNIDKEDIDSDLNELEYIIKVLVRCLNNIS